jgi:hypothetical protein
MGFRRSPDRIAANREWQRFLGRNGRLIAASGLAPAAVADITAFDHFLMHGVLAGDPSGETVDTLTPAQYQSLVELAGNYFAAGYEFYVPAALNAADQAALRARFGARP